MPHRHICSVATIFFPAKTLYILSPTGKLAFFLVCRSPSRKTTTFLRQRQNHLQHCFTDDFQRGNRAVQRQGQSMHHHQWMMRLTSALVTLTVLEYISWLVPAQYSNSKPSPFIATCEEISLTNWLQIC